MVPPPRPPRRAAGAPTTAAISADAPNGEAEDQCRSGYQGAEADLQLGWRARDRRLLKAIAEAGLRVTQQIRERLEAGADARGGQLGADRARRHRGPGGHGVDQASSTLSSHSHQQLQPQAHPRAGGPGERADLPQEIA